MFLVITLHHSRQDHGGELIEDVSAVKALSPDRRGGNLDEVQGAVSVLGRGEKNEARLQLISHLAGPSPLLAT